VTRGTVINIHGHGALLRLEDGALAVVRADELSANRPAYTASLRERSMLDVTLDRTGRHAVARLGTSPVPLVAPVASEENALATDDVFEGRIDAYLKETEAWAPADRPAPSERHFIRKKRRAAIFEARNKLT
jgi:hypothetical protein